MIILHQYRPKFGVPNLSPFCLKVEAWLRMAELDYEVKYEDDPRKAPLGKLPSINDQGEVIPDSTLIINHLEEKYHPDLDGHLSEEQRAVSHAFQRMMEERLYWTYVYNRWLGGNWPNVKAAVFNVLPPFIRTVVPVLVQKQVKRDLHGHGLGRHKAETIYYLAERDIDALAVYLGDKQYFMGDALSTVDAVLFAFICNLLKVELESPMKTYASKYKNLQAYHERLGKRYFSEYYA